MMSQEPRIAVIIPCHNEEPTVAAVVTEFRKVLPSARVYVFDNVSSDRTAEAARKAGAVVVRSPQKGKGHVVRHMFREVEADWYIMVDGDATYSAESASTLLKKAREDNLDMLVGQRVTPREAQAEAYRPMHQLGNRMVCWLIGASFGGAIMDVFSGYRVFSREFVKTVPLVAAGFDTEVEMTLQALSKNYRIGEVPTPYSSRPEGSFSKLHTYRDGSRVLLAFFRIFKSYRPGLFYGILAVLLACGSLLFGLPAVWDYIQFRYVYHVPLALLATGLAIISALSASIGLILQTQLRYHNENFAMLRRIRPPQDEGCKTP